MEFVVKSREQANQDGDVFYFTGIQCKNGHIDKRYTNTGICYACKREQNQRDRTEHTERCNQSARMSYSRNRERAKKSGRRWALNNRDRVIGIKRKWKIVHRDQNLESGREYQARKRQDPYFHLAHNLSKAIWLFLNEGKSNSKWETLIGYSFLELRNHLEGQFSAEMSWDNYCGYWEIDHIVPQSYFQRIERTPEEKLRLSFSLVNLRPCPKLGIGGNLHKFNKLIPELANPVLKALGLD